MGVSPREGHTSFFARQNLNKATSDPGDRCRATHGPGPTEKRAAAKYADGRSSSPGFEAYAPCGCPRIVVRAFSLKRQGIPDRTACESSPRDWSHGVPTSAVRLVDVRQLQGTSAPVARIRATAIGF